MGVMVQNSKNQLNPFEGISAFAWALNNTFDSSDNNEASPFYFSDISSFNLQKKENDIHYDTNMSGLANYSSFEKNKVLNKILTIKEYEGFNLVEVAETTVDYKSDAGSFVRFFKTLFLEKYTHNKYYLEPYLVICPELELEGVGVTKGDAFLDICKLFDIYYTEAANMGENLQDLMDLIETNINSINPWKQEFYRLFWDKRKGANIPFNNYSYVVSIKE